MKSKSGLEIGAIAKGLGAEQRGRIKTGAGVFAASRLAAEVSRRFRVPAGGGRATDPGWTEQRQVRLSPQTLARLERLAEEVSEKGKHPVHPMQVAAVILERAAAEMSARDLE